MAHTRGPWEYLPPIMNDKKGTVMGGGMDGYDSIIATVHNPSGYDQSINLNGQLIAAAPELLEALEFAIENVHLGTGPRYTEAIERMEEAIQKAGRK